MTVIINGCENAKPNAMAIPGAAFVHVIDSSLFSQTRHAKMKVKTCRFILLKKMNQFFHFN